jgi:hypothetical protein
VASSSLLGFASLQQSVAHWARGNRGGWIIASAVPQDNVELAHRAYDAVNRRDVDAFLGLMDADVELLAAMEGSYRGHDGVRRWWHDLLNAIPDLTIEVGEVRNL